MQILVWNVRGFNNPLKQREVVGRVRRLNVSIVCLLETRVKRLKMQKIVDKQFQGWKLYHNYSEALNGRIWLLWKNQVQVDLVAITNQSITCCIIDDAKIFYLSVIYGCNDGVGRRLLWNHL